MTALDSARSSFPNVTQWVVSGHSLGGTVAALEAQQADADADQTLARTDIGARKAPVVGLILFASYPAGDMSDVTIPVLSISGENDGLSTPDAIAASLPNLPTTTTFIQVPGASHSSFGDYGLQAGDGTATASRTNTYNDITQATVAFVNARD
jgi:pimeloyl-ACP methyl ester carboxylesterase